MKKVGLVVFLALVMSHLGAGRADAQFRATESREELEREVKNTLGAMSSQDESIFSKLFNMNNWSTRQTYSFSYSSNGPQSVGLSMFTNTFMFRPSDDMMFSADVSAVYSPFSSFGNDFQKQINGIYLTNARLDWKLGESTFMTVQYSGSPVNQYSDPFYSPWSSFDRFGSSNSTLLTSQAGFGSNGWRTTKASVTR